jgi:cobalt-zinc-cadmium efflux system protein
VFGVFSNSTALLADAGHNLADVLGLLAAWGASRLATWPPSQTFAWGMRGSSVLAALANAVLLFVGAGAIGWEAIHKLYQPEPVAGRVVMAVAAAGILVNGVTALLFSRGRQHDINIRGAFLHMAADALVSAAVLLSGLVVAATGWTRADPLVGLAVAVFIVWGTWGLFRDSFALSLAGVPRSVDAKTVRTYLAGQPGVAALHDLHIWPIGTTETALSAHLVMPGGHPGDGFLLRIGHELREQGIGHVTIQIETDAAACPLAPENVV